MASGADSATERTTPRSQSPAPARNVSSTWRSGVSSLASAAAIPPCAHAVLLTSSSSLASTNTSAPSAAASAAARPAIPAPMTRTSAA